MANLSGPISVTLPGLGRQQEGVRWRPDASLTPPAKGLYRWPLQAAAKHRWALIALDLQVDTSTANGEAMAYVVAVFANLERRLISERTRAGLAEAARQGTRLGRPRTLPADVVERIVAERQKGATLQAIADRLTAEGLPGAQGGQR